jgi:ABC-type nitrate/sulfonate/bicarbonate transport system substrate-binding protein
MNGFLRAVATCGAVLAATMVSAGAADKLRVGKAVPFAWTFTPLDVGIHTGIFAREGLEIEVTSFAGDAKLQQGLTADSIDVGIGSGPGMAFMAKGVPAKAVAAMAGVPANMAVMVNYNSPIRTVDDLKGKKIGVTTVGSLTDWLSKRIAVTKGWGPTGVTTVPVGGMESSRAVMKTGQIDAMITSLESGYALEEAKEWRVLTAATPFVDHFITHVHFVRDEVIAKKPQLVSAFLRGWFAAIAFMKANKEKAVEITAKVVDLSPSVISRTYDEEIVMFSVDGTFDPRAITVLKQSFIEMGLLKDIPEDQIMFTTRFLPVKAAM